MNLKLYVCSYCTRIHFYKTFTCNQQGYYIRTTPNQSNILSPNNYLLHVANKSILIIGKSLPAITLQRKLSADAVIITGNPKLYMSQINALVTSPVIVFDSSNPAWKIERWKKDCNSLHLRFHTVAQEGAFVMDCN